MAVCYILRPWKEAGRNIYKAYIYIIYFSGNGLNIFYIYDCPQAYPGNFSQENNRKIIGKITKKNLRKINKKTMNFNLNQNIILFQFIVNKIINYGRHY